jgi:hypothetical protein
MLTLRPGRLPLSWTALLFGCLAAPAGQNQAPATGTIRGSIDRPQAVTAVTAIDRATDKRYPGKVEAGGFVVTALPLGAAYDLILDQQGGARLEGVNLKVPPVEGAEALSKDDRAALDKLVHALNQFEDTVEVLAVAGHSERAAIFLNKLRTKPFVNSQPGEIVWRAELWRFEKPDETWIKAQDELFTVYYRERLQKAAFDQKSVTFDPVLGGLTPTAEQPAVDVGKVALPEAKPGVRLRAGK